ncbi:hypothetical protein [Paenibacillus medicaginis]|uniref:Uncharacterized protein n=1 Tax=Paenibacillus medicaginis TaxID=1470560 RepID=A0ABV5BUI7_9BACL
MYTIGNTVIHISMDFKEIVTIYKVEKKAYIAETKPENPLYYKLKKLYENEMKRYDREEKKYSKKIESLRVDLDFEIAALKRRMFRTRSQAVKLACEARIKAIDEYFSEIEQSLKHVQGNKRKVAKAMVSLV